ncbi:hypothetical protein NE579_16235, partial [Intestinimonas massiliensis]
MSARVPENTVLSCNSALFSSRLKSGAVESQDSGGPIQVTYQFEVIDGRLGNTPLSGRSLLVVGGVSSTCNVHPVPLLEAAGKGRVA